VFASVRGVKMSENVVRTSLVAVFFIVHLENQLFLEIVGVA